MCGIAGYFGIENKLLLKKMLKILKHRGPDDCGVFFDKNIALGNRRLSIIDIKLGKQPIHNEKKDIWIVFNGEIYNFLELREELIKLGHNFYTKSDTETIVHAYEEWGVKCLEKLNGMFAFAIWDKRKRILFLARDRFGIKPLYYYLDGKKFIFASEIKAILQDKSIQIMPNEKSIYKFLVYGFNDDEEETFFEGIKRLLPAHYMVVKKNDIKIKRYWKLKIGKRLKKFKNEDEIAEQLYNLLEDSIKKHLISEVPVGTCLSGGIDSSLIVCVINKLLKKNGNLTKVIGEMQKTFSAVYDDKKIDERKYIEEIIKFTGVEKNYTFPSSKKLWKDLKKIVYFQDEPFLGPSIYAQWEVMKLASKKVKVLLDGQGGDEIFAGYIPYYGIYFRNLLKEKKYFQLLKEFLLSLDLTLPFVFKYFSQKRVESEIKKMLDENFVKKYEKKVKNKWIGNDLAKFLQLEITKTSLPRLLRYEDRNSSAFSIEARVPFLDHRIVEFVFSLPISMRIKNGWTKYILRKAVKGIVPEKIRWRRSKIGFAVPEKKWLIELKDKITKIFLSKEFESRKYFNQEEIVRKFKYFCEGKLNEEHARIFWRILVLEFWFRVFLNRKGNEIANIKYM
ncbi:MAG: asparagine synthase (glutamine-hydrolyzing) [Candidatus Aenigmatarchaeota archaeon]